MRVKHDRRIRSVSRWIAQCASSVRAPLEGPFVIAASWVWEQLPPSLSPQTITFHCFHASLRARAPWLATRSSTSTLLTFLRWKRVRKSDTSAQNAKCHKQNNPAESAAQVKQDKTRHGVLLERSRAKTLASVYRNVLQIRTHHLKLERLREVWRSATPPRGSVSQRLQCFILQTISGSPFQSPLMRIQTVGWGTLISLLFKLGKKHCGSANTCSRCSRKSTAVPPKTWVWPNLAINYRRLSS